MVENSTRVPNFYRVPPEENTCVGVSFLIKLTVFTFISWFYKLFIQKQPFANDL